MSDVVLAALIGAAASIIINLITVASQNRKRALDEAVRDANLENRLGNIERKLETHNSYAEKLEGIQRDMGEIQTDIAVIKNEVKNLRQQA